MLNSYKMRIGDRPSFLTALKQQTFQQQITSWNSEIESGLGDEFKQGFPAVRSEFYEPTLNVLKDQKAQLLGPRNRKLGENLLDAGVTVSGQALFGQAGIVLQLMVKDGAMQVLYRDANGSQALESTPGKIGSTKRDGYTVDLPTGRHVSFMSEKGTLFIHSADELGEIASTFQEADRADDGAQPLTMNLLASSVGDEGLLSGISLIPAAKQGDAANVQLFSFHEDRERGTLRGEVYGRYGPVGLEIDSNLTHQRMTRQDAPTDLETQDPDSVMKFAEASVKAADNFLR